MSAQLKQCKISRLEKCVHAKYLVCHYSSRVPRSAPFVATRGPGRALNGVWRPADPPPGAPRPAPQLRADSHNLLQTTRPQPRTRQGTRGKIFKFSSNSDIKIIRYQVKILILKNGQHPFTNNSFRKK